MEGAIVGAIPPLMTSFQTSLTPAKRGSLFRGLSIVLVSCALTGAAFAQNDANAQNGNANGNGGGRRRGQNGQNGDTNGNGGRNFDPAQMQERMMTALRDQFGVTDDAEWKIISDRITPVMELRRNAATGFGGLGAFRNNNNNQGGGNNRFGRAASPEQDALRQAITDNLPEAEIKSRLARLRDVRKANEEKLAKAQEDLRAVLSVKQEAIAVMAGLLP